MFELLRSRFLNRKLFGVAIFCLLGALIFGFQNCSRPGSLSPTDGLVTTLGMDGGGGIATGNGEGYTGKPDKIFVYNDLNPCHLPNLKQLRLEPARRLFFYPDKSVVVEDLCTSQRLTVDTASLMIQPENLEVLGYDNRIFMDEANTSIPPVVKKVLLSCVRPSTNLKSGKLTALIGYDDPPIGSMAPATPFLDISDTTGPAPVRQTTPAVFSLSPNGADLWTALQVLAALTLEYTEMTGEFRGSGLLNGEVSGQLYSSEALTCIRGI